MPKCAEQLGSKQRWLLDPAENLLGASMPLQSQALGATVAEVTAQPSRELGVDLDIGVVAAPELRALEMGAGDALGLSPGREGEGGWLYGLKDPPPWGVRPSCASMPLVRAG